MSINAFLLFVQTICHALIAGLKKSFPSKFIQKSNLLNDCSKWNMHCITFEAFL